MQSSFTRLLRKLVTHYRKKRLPYTPLIEVKIYREAILKNLKAFQNLNSAIAVAPVLKSNAYGHGLVEVATILEREEVPFFCVDSFFEALALRNKGIQSPILIIGYTPLETMLQNKLKNIAFCIISLEELQEAVAHIRACTKIHLKIDTGMHRHGLLPGEVTEALSLIRKNKHLELEGIYSHLADADSPDSLYTAKQIACWNAAVKDVLKEFPNIAYLHCAATAGASHASEIKANVIRLGIGLYGINTGIKKLDLRPALEMETCISSIRTLKLGEPVGYNATFKTEKETRIASLPVGYNEGVDRRLSNIGTVLVHDTPCRIVGRVSMNITSIDVSQILRAKIKDKVTVISASPDTPNSIENIASRCNTIPYEIMVHIPAHLRRTVV